MNNLLNNILENILKFNSFISTKVSNKINDINDVNKFIKITEIRYNPAGEYLEFIIQNKKLADHKPVLKNIYNLLMSNKQFKKFGHFKVIFISAIIDGGVFSFHHNVLITNTTTFDQYYKKVKNIIITNYDAGYPVDVIPTFRVLI